MRTVVETLETPHEQPRVADRRMRRDQRGDAYRLTALGGLAALSLDALSSVAYGPEAIVLALIPAGVGAVAWTLPVSLAITALLLVLVLSYRQVIAVHPDGGGAYAVAEKDLGRGAALLAAASLVVDYVLTVAVSLAAGAASLASAFPALADHLLLATLLGLVVLTVLNLIGIAESAKVLMGSAIVFVLSIFAVIAGGFLHHDPVAVIGADLGPVEPVEAVGIVLLLKAFSAGCSALTGVEAIANAVPAFRTPAVKRAQHTEIALGALLGMMLIGLSLLIRQYHMVPRGDVTILARLSAATFGTGWMFYLTNIAVTLVLVLAANTSFGGLPVLLGVAERRRTTSSRPLVHQAAAPSQSTMIRIASGSSVIAQCPVFGSRCTSVSRRPSKTSVSAAGMCTSSAPLSTSMGAFQSRSSHCRRVNDDMRCASSASVGSMSKPIALPMIPRMP